LSPENKTLNRPAALPCVVAGQTPWRIDKKWRPSQTRRPRPPPRSDTARRLIDASVDFGFDRKDFYPCYGMAEATLFIVGERPDSVHSAIAPDVDALERASSRVIDKTHGEARRFG
jgi:hypothetical protein